MNNDVVISFKNVSKEYRLYSSNRKRLLGIFLKKVPYKKKLAVNDVSFTVNRGDSVALFGKNGAGKSTILKMITGVTFPTTGEIKVNGRVSALLELTSGFDQEFSGRENIYLKGHILGLKDSEIKALEDTIIAFSELEDYIDQPVRTYSSGMKSRLGFAINVNIKPEILIVDEALSVGDAAFKNKCKEKVNDIIKNDNVTLLFVTHQTAVAEEFCKRGIVMKDGKLLFDGEVAESAKKYDELYKKKKKK
jgi:teichoic acid transport system ATP-binding protein